MHDVYREKDVPGNVDLVTSDVGELPSEDRSLDAPLSIRAFHHGIEDVLVEIRRALRSGGGSS